MNEMQQLLGISGGILFLAGVFYAWQIYLAPSPHGYTAISVAVGVLLWILGQFLFDVILWHFEKLTITNTLLSPLAVLILTGGPMGAAQAWKKYREDKRNDKYTEGGDEPKLE